MERVNRRGFLKGSLASAASAPLLESQAPGAVPIVDTHVYLSRWPTRRMLGDQAPELVELLRGQGVSEAWAGSFDALLAKDVAAVNQRLARDCGEAGRGFLKPFGAVNPKLPDWQEDVRRCHEELRMPGLRIHPNYHNYTLRDPGFLELLRLAAERGLILQIAAWMEDERCHIPLMRVPRVDLSPLPALLEKVPGARVIVLNGFISPARLEPLLAQFGKYQVAFDFAMLDGMEELGKMARAVGIGRVVFGSYSPMFYFESALLKVREAALTPAESESVFARNARRLLAKS
jgi:uncharacterized protein